MRDPIFIAGSHKSGTSLLRGLLDGHPSLFVIPIETHFFEHCGRWVDYRPRRTVPGSGSRTEFLASTSRWIRESNRAADPQADSVMTGRFSEGEFADYIEQLPEGAGDQVRCEYYFEAIYRSLRGESLPGTLRVVEKSVENAEFACELASMWPGSRFIHIVRNPYATLVAFRRFRSNGGYPWLGGAYRAIYHSFYHLDRNRRLIDNYMVVRYEDLVTDPHSEVRRICDHLRLDFTEELLQPTSLGEPWAGNSTTGEDFQGISDSRIGAWQDSITPLEAAIVNEHLSHVLTEFNYDAYSPDGWRYWPAGRESLKVYLANRMLLKLG